MPAHVTVELDTTPPVVAWGIPDRLNDGRVMVPYAINEPEIIAAEVGGGSVNVFPDRLETYGILQQGGLIHVSAQVRDEVGNEAILSAVLGLAPIPGRIGRPSEGTAGGSGTGVVRRPGRGRIPRPETGGSA